MGGLICGEHTNSLTRFSLIARGEKIHVASWPAFPEKIYPGHQNETVLFRIRDHAHEGKVFVISSSGHFSQEMVDLLCRTGEERARIHVGGGCSAIVGVNREFLAGLLINQEGILYADLDFENIIEAKLEQDVLGHYSRFDVLSLNFNEKKLIPIHYGHRTFSQNEFDSVIGSLQTKIDKIEQTLNLFLAKRDKEIV